MKSSIYFDNAATTPVHPKVFEKMKPFLEEEYGNPSSIHSFGRNARVAIEEARENIADFIGANPSEIYFTSGGTEANNFLIRGIAQTEFVESRRNEILTAQAEHHAVLDTFAELNKSDFNAAFLAVNKQTKVELHSILESITPQSSLASFMHVNNETGSVNNIKELSSPLRARKIIFHTDAVQSFGKIPVNVIELGIDALSASAHKINGPKGIGFAYAKSGTPLSPLLYGGSQERNRRGGTENISGIVGLAEAVSIRKENMNYFYEHVSHLRKIFVEGIINLDCDFIYLNSGDDALPYIVSITLDSQKYKNDADSMVMYLDINGLAVSSGSACTSGTIKASHVILACGYKPEDASGTLRFSFGYQNTIEEVAQSLGIMKQFLLKFKK
ncbi:MAG: aminotransferase class V [Ignavibacteria bacterium]|nr:MAG: aminotransferase class V [Ignavibacteria bacterium]KAF0160904.1 MAG: aminotransferase class V [Ignavibacteria bacterium]